MSSPSSFATPSSFVSSFGSSFAQQTEVVQEPPLPKPPLPISKEFDMIAQKHYSKVETDRSRWLERAMAEAPEIGEFRERVNPVSRASKFARLYLPSSRYISHQTLLALIAQHLRTLGLVETQSSLHSEWDGPFDIPAHLQRSQLTYLIQRGILRADNFWELTSGSSQLTPEERKKALDEEISKTIGGAPNIAEDSLSDHIGEENYKVDEENRLTRATFNQLILLLTSKTSVNMEGVDSAFFLTYKGFVTSQGLFSKLRERFRMAQKMGDKEAMDRTFELFEMWIDKCGREIEQPIVEAMRAFTEKELKQFYPRQCQSLFELGVSSLTLTIDPTRAPKVVLGGCSDSLWTGSFQLTDLPEVEFARQITVWTCRRYYSVQRTEFLDSAWENPRLKHRAPNIVALIEHHNQMSRWVSSTVISERGLERRLQVWRYFIEVLRQLWEMRNYLDAWGIIGGLETNEMYRLTAHRKMIPKAQLEYFESLKKCYTEHGSTFKKMREIHEQALAARAPSIPYVGFLLADLRKYSDIEPNYIDGLLNVTKIVRMNQFINAFEVFGQYRYNFLPIEQVQGKLDDLPTIDPSVLAIMSVEIEPDGSTPESLRANESSEK